ncbi:MAG: hypothetical protein AVDCRST_MAG02-2069, partial [uncultured Rubrobacteraceae bacterium]
EPPYLCWPALQTPRPSRSPYEGGPGRQAVGRAFHHPGVRRAGRLLAPRLLAPRLRRERSV